RRRRHTRLVSDWSSDVCSSDLRKSCRSSSPRQGGSDKIEAITERPSRPLEPNNALDVAKDTERPLQIFLIRRGVRIREMTLSRLSALRQGESSFRHSGRKYLAVLLARGLADW